MNIMKWEKTVAVEALKQAGGVLAHVIGQEEVAIYLVDDEVYATSNVCTHGQARLSEGYLIGEMIECPMHQGLFDVRTGAVMGPPCTEAIRSYPVRIDDGIITIGLVAEPGHPS